eukprot:8100719-Prorocentrum_lima.AAC.1
MGGRETTARPAQTMREQWNAGAGSWQQWPKVNPASGGGHCRCCRKSCSKKLLHATCRVHLQLPV